MLVVLGPNGVAVSTDDAKSWAPLDPGDFWSVAFGAPFRF